jgi:hypothetical protein
MATQSPLLETFDRFALLSCESVPADLLASVRWAVMRAPLLARRSRSTGRTDSLQHCLAESQNCAMLKDVVTCLDCFIHSRPSPEQEAPPCALKRS